MSETLRERLLKHADGVPQVIWEVGCRPNGSDWDLGAVTLLREAAAALAAPREPDGWIAPPDAAAVRRGVSARLYGDERMAGVGAIPVYIGAPAPAETREQEVDNA